MDDRCKTCRGNGSLGRIVDRRDLYGADSIVDTAVLREHICWDCKGSGKSNAPDDSVKPDRK